MLKKHNIIRKKIPKWVLRSRSRCRRKLYHLLAVLEKIFLYGQKTYKLKNERSKIKLMVYEYLSEQLGIPVKKLRFKTMSNKQCLNLELLLDNTTSIHVIEWIRNKIN